MILTIKGRLRILTPEQDGYVLRKKDDILIYSKKVYLGNLDSEENWEEVEEEIAIKESKELEKEIETINDYENNEHY